MYIANYTKMLSLVEKHLSVMHPRSLKTRFLVGKDISDRICYCKIWSQKVESLMKLATKKSSYHKLKTRYIRLIFVAYFATVLTVAYAVANYFATGISIKNVVAKWSLLMTNNFTITHPGCKLSSFQSDH